MGLCFATVIDGVCQGSLKRMEKVTQPECCCTGGGKAWGPNCAACPVKGSAAELSLCGGRNSKNFQIVSLKLLIEEIVL